jgi:hypothetical protein
MPGSKRWKQNPGGGGSYEDADPAVEAFLADILSVYRKHRMAISDNGFGGFVVENLEKADEDSLLASSDGRCATTECD